MTELAVLVPVLNRPQNVKPLVESFEAQHFKGSELYFILSPGDYEEAAAVKAVTRYWIEGPWRTWPEKINAGVGAVKANWYLFAADDITLTPGWWEATKELRDDPGIGVIGTNDSHSGTGNPRVAAGEHTCHPLVRASYIRDLGTSDEPGKAVHDGYSHWCVDDELVWTAKLRNAWAFCRDAVIEHHHPYWKPDTVQWDATYAAGEANAKADMELWAYRARHVLGLTVG